jgi:hypothetical protein
LSRLPGAFSQTNLKPVKMFVKSTVAVALLASFVAAQNNNITFDPSTVDLTIRSQYLYPSADCKNSANIHQINGARPSSTPAIFSVARNGTQITALP